MALILPFDSSNPFYTFNTTIAGAEYIFNVRWNTRDAAWYFDVSEIDNTPIANGIKVVLGCYLGRHTQHTLFRDGVIVATDLSSSGIDAGIDDLGVRVVVMRMTIDEVLSLRIVSSFPNV